MFLDRYEPVNLYEYSKMAGLAATAVRGDALPHGYFFFAVRTTKPMARVVGGLLSF